MNVADLVNAVLEKKDYTARLVNGVSNYIRGYHQALIDISEDKYSSWLIYDPYSDDFEFGVKKT